MSETLTGCLDGPSNSGIMVMLSDVSVGGRNSEINAGCDGCQNVMTSRPAINGKSDMVTDAASGRSERDAHGLTDE